MVSFTATRKATRSLSPPSLEMVLYSGSLVKLPFKKTRLFNIEHSSKNLETRNLKLTQYISLSSYKRQHHFRFFYGLFSKRPKIRYLKNITTPKLSPILLAP